MFLIDFNEFGNGHFHPVGAPDQISLLDLSKICDSFICLVALDGVIDRVRDLREGLSLLTVAKLLLLDFNLVG